MKNALLTLSLTSFFGAPAYAEAASAVSPGQPQPSREELCRQYAATQFKAVNFGTISGTTMASQYDKKTGFCSVQVEHKGDNNSFSSHMMTNTFDGISPTGINIQTYAMPARIHWPVAVPQTLVCAKVYTSRNGKIICEPYRDGPNLWLGW
jgi:hypothetical protein